MKLKLLEALKNATIQKPVAFTFAGVEVSLVAHFRLATNDEHTELTKKSDVEISKALLVGWSDFTDDGQPIEYKETLRDDLLAYPAIALRLAKAGIDAQYEVQEKN